MQSEAVRGLKRIFDQGISYSGDVKCWRDEHGVFGYSLPTRPFVIRVADEFFSEGLESVMSEVQITKLFRTASDEWMCLVEDVNVIKV